MKRRRRDDYSSDEWNEVIQVRERLQQEEAAVYVMDCSDAAPVPPSLTEEEQWMQTQCAKTCAETCTAVKALIDGELNVMKRSFVCFPSSSPLIVSV